MEPKCRPAGAVGSGRETDGPTAATWAPGPADGQPLGPLAGASLSLMGDGATAAELAERLTSAFGNVTPERAGALLDDLAGRGLVRVMRAGRSPRYGITSLGIQSMGLSVANEEALADRLRELERLRTDLLATVSHELRTPLTAIRTSIGLLLDPATEPDEAELMQLLKTIERNADRMQRLVSDILDLARYRAGHVQLQLRRFEAQALAREVSGSISPLVAAHGQVLRLDLPGPPLWVYGDHRRLEQALLNLVSNAQKFSPDGAAITLAVRSWDDHVTWTVSDVGPGISDEDQARLFERFFVGRDDRSGHRAGVGLGLPTALAIAQAHGGRIDVQSTLGSGSDFALVVPAAGPEDEDDD
ncbi:MAG TPA: ATP-binding protein [Candidatus Limnocylindrales bacterium]